MVHASHETPSKIYNTIALRYKNDSRPNLIWQTKHSTSQFCYTFGNDTFRSEKRPAKVLIFPNYSLYDAPLFYYIIFNFNDCRNKSI